MCCFFFKTNDFPFEKGPLKLWVSNWTVASKFKHQKRYCVHVQMNTLEKDANPPFPIDMILMVPLLSFYKDAFIK